MADVPDVNDPEAALALFRHQRACRTFLSDDVPDHVVEAVLDAATRAPSAQNLQPWVFVVVRDAERRAAVWEVGLRLWEAGGREVSAASDPPALHTAVDAALAGGGFAAAPVTVVVAADTTRCPPGSLESSVWPATQNLLLAATALGLGSALTTIGTFFADDLRAVVDLPEHITPVAVVPLGHAARPLGPNRRQPVAEHAHRERFGQGW